MKTKITNSRNASLNLIARSYLLVLLFLMCNVVHAIAQTGSLWSDVPKSKLKVTKENQKIIPNAFRTVRLDQKGLKTFLTSVPMESNVFARNSNLIISLPMPDGSFQNFSVVESPVIEPALMVKYPEIKTYLGQGTDDPSATVRFGWTLLGFHALIITRDDYIFIEPYTKGNLRDYMVYFKKDMVFPTELNFNEEGMEETDQTLFHGMLRAPSGTQLRTYRIAIGAAGEFYAANGGTVALAISAIVIILNQDDAIYENEVAVRFVLVANNSKIVFSNSATDPYTTAGNPCSSPVRTENQTTCDDSIGSANYDIGHVFTGTNIGGCGSIGSVCTGGSKARGASGVGFGNAAFDVSLSCHEMGHQFGANHTFNSSVAPCGGQYSAGTAYEPGSGSSIMSYAGSCDNIQGNRDMFFHTISYDEIIAYTTAGGGSGCPNVSATGNNPPSVNAGAGGFTIPINTPFALTGSANDPDGDPLTYSWEEFDLGPAGAPNSPSGNAPIFRSFPPANSPTRTFPQLSDLLNNTQTMGEILPGYTRSLSFRLTARDNKSGGGGVDYAAMSFNVEVGAGPFLVTSPNTAINWCGGSTQTVTWNVANTDILTVNTANVNILLSIDGGNTFPITLASNTANDGSELITVPNNPVVSNARVKVEAVGNVFFDISNVNFTITQPDVNAGHDKFLNCSTIVVVLDGSSSTPGVDYLWTTYGNGHIVTGADSPTPTVDSAGVYTLTVTEPLYGCTAADSAEVIISPPVPCEVCNQNVIYVNSNVTIDFNTDPPATAMPPALLPFYTYSRVGLDPSLWKAIFDVGANSLVVQSGVTIKTSPVKGFAPGIEIRGTCELEIENGARIIVASTNKNAGDILVQMYGNIIVNGEVRNEVSGTRGLPGCITMVTKCGHFNVGSTGLIHNLGIDEGACGVTLLACGTDCDFYGSGHITVSGLVKAYAHAHAGNQTLNRPDIKVLSFNGNVTVNANTAEPRFDEYSSSGTLYDIYNGLLSWVRDNVNPGKVEVQSRKNTEVNGHGTDPTGAVRKSFGAIAAVSTASNSPGGLIDVRSEEGTIVANDRAFDVTGRNKQIINFARIRLYSKFDISLNRPGANNNFNPVLNASSPFPGGRGGTNEIRSYSGRIVIGTNAKISALVTPGLGSIQGINLLEACTGIVNSGSVVPEDLVPGDSAGSCAPDAPTALHDDCFALSGGVFREMNEESIAAISETVKVYPNPASGKITLEFLNLGSDRYSVNLSDITGRIMISNTVDAKEGTYLHEIDLSQIAKGMYLLIIENTKTKELKRIIIQ